MEQKFKNHFDNMISQGIQLNGNFAVIGISQDEKFKQIFYSGLRNLKYDYCEGDSYKVWRYTCTKSAITDYDFIINEYKEKGLEISNLTRKHCLDMSVEETFIYII